MAASPDTTVHNDEGAVAEESVRAPNLRLGQEMVDDDGMFSEHHNGCGCGYFRTLSLSLQLVLFSFEKCFG